MLTHCGKTFPRCSKPSLVELVAVRSVMRADFVLIASQQPFDQSTGERITRS